jgi:dUTP pyrophosphatase
MPTSPIAFKTLNPFAKVPTYANPGDAGADLYSCEDVEIHPGTWTLVDTGIAIALPKSFVGLVHPRSGLAARLGVTVLNAPGTVDSGYRGSIKVNLINHGKSIFRISKGDRIAQLVIQEFKTAHFLGVYELEPSARGDAGHGSTGMREFDGRIQEQKS